MTFHARIVPCVGAASARRSLTALAPGMSLDPNAGVFTPEENLSYVGKGVWPTESAGLSALAPHASSATLPATQPSTVLDIAYAPVNSIGAAALTGPGIVSALVPAVAPDDGTTSANTDMAPGAVVSGCGQRVTSRHSQLLHCCFSLCGPRKVSY